MPGLSSQRSLGREEGETAKAAGRIENDELAGNVPAILPTIVKGIRLRGGWITDDWITRENEAFCQRGVSVQIGVLGLHVALRNSRWRQGAGIGRGPLADDVALPLPTHAREISDIHRVAAAFVVHIGENGCHV